MSQYMCFYPNCAEKPIGKCDCVESFVIFCDSHDGAHLRSSRNLRHVFIDLYITPDKKTQKSFIQKCSEIKMQIKTIKNQFSNEYKSIVVNLIRKFKENNQKLQDLESRLNEFIKLASQNELPNIYSEKDFEFLLTLTPDAVNHKMSN